jgi:hypothetical protein
MKSGQTKRDRALLREMLVLLAGLSDRAEKAPAKPWSLTGAGSAGGWALAVEDRSEG